MLKIYTGRARWGKTSRLLEEIGAGAAQGRRQILLVPEMLSHETERRLLQSCGNPIAHWAEVLTFKRMAQRILEESGGVNQPLLDAGGRVLAMYRAIRQAESALGHYRTAGTRPEMIEKLVGLVDELKSCRISPEQLLEAAPQAGSAAGKITDLALLYSAYSQVTGALAMDDKDLLTAAWQGLAHCDFGRDWDFYIDGFFGMTGQERALLEGLLGRCHAMHIALLHQPEEPLFYEQNQFLLRMQAMALRSGVACQVEELPQPQARRAPSLEQVERGLFDYAVGPLAGSPQGVELYRLQSPQEECEFAASLARQALAAGLRCRQIALAAGDMERYQPLLENAFARFQVPIFLAQKTDILQKPVLAAVNGALQAVAQGMTYEGVFAYLKSGLSPLESDQVDLLENYVLTWNLRGQAYFKPFYKNPAGYDEARAAAGAELLPVLEGIRQTMAKPLAALQQRVASCRVGADYAAALGDFLEQIGLEGQIAQKIAGLEKAGCGRESAEYTQLYEILQGALEQFAGAMTDQPMDLGEFLRLWRLTLSQYSVSAIPVALDNVQAGSFERLSFHEIELLIVLGAREGLLPPSGAGSGLLTEHERGLLLEAGLELTQTAEGHAYETQSHIYRGMAAPAGRLVVLYPEKAMDGSACRPSYLLRRLMGLLPGLTLSAPEGSWRLTAAGPSFEQACASAGGKGGQLAETARQLALERQDQSAYFAKLRQYAAGPRGPIASKALIAAAYGKQVRMTASRAEKIASCRFSYFMEYGLKARQRKRAQFGAPETGTFLHEVVEHTIADLSQDPSQEPRQVAQVHIQRFLQQNLPLLQEESPRFGALLARTQRMVLDIVEDVWQELQHSQFAPICFELAFGPGEQNPAITLECGDMTLSLSGKIDRVDGYLQGDTLYIKVADYKTGQKDFRLSDILYGINLQMFIYLLMAQQGRQVFLEQGQGKLGGQPKQVATAGVLYIPAKAPFVPMEYGEGQEKAAEKMGKALRRIGLVLDDPQVLEAMEQPQGGEYRFLPVAYKKDGSFKAGASVTSSQGFARLVRGVDRQLRRIAQLLAQGDIEAQPITTGPEWSACDWCAYAQACHFDETMEKDKRHKIKKLPDDQVYAQLQREEEQEDGN